MATAGKRATTERTEEDTGEGASAASAVAGLPEFSQRQMALAAEAMSQWFSRLEALQRAQLHMSERAVLLHRQAADNLRRATSPVELMTVQGTLAMYQFQEGARFWQEWLSAANKVATDSANTAKAATGGAADTTGAQSPAAAAMGAAMTAAGPMAEAFQQMFMAPLQAANNQAH